MIKLHTLVLCAKPERVFAFRRSLEQNHDLNIAGVCSSLSELQMHLSCRRLDLIIVDLDSFDHEDAAASIHRIAEVSPDRGIIAISANKSPETIISLMRLGRVQFVSAPIEAHDLDAAVDAIAQMRFPAERSGTIVAVIGASGGAGATTVATNLAMELALASGQRAGIVDLHPYFGDAACAFDIRPKHSLLEICQGDGDIDATLIETAFESLPGNLVLLASDNISDSDEYEVAPEQLQKAISTMATFIPFVVLDVPRFLSAPVVATLQMADHVFVVSQLSVPHIRNASRLFDLLDKSGVRDNRIELILNRHGSEFERVQAAEVEQQLGRKAYAVIPNDYKRMGESRDFGRPLSAAAPSSPARTAIIDIATRLVRPSIPSEVAAPSSGWLKRLFRGKSEPAELVAVP